MARDIGTDIATLRGELQREIASVRTEISAVHASVLHLVVRAALALQLLVAAGAVVAMWRIARG